MPKNYCDNCGKKSELFYEIRRKSIFITKLERVCADCVGVSTLFFVDKNHSVSVKIMKSEKKV